MENSRLFPFGFKLKILAIMSRVGDISLLVNSEYKCSYTTICASRVTTSRHDSRTKLTQGHGDSKDTFKHINFFWSFRLKDDTASKTAFPAFSKKEHWKNYCV